MRTVVLTRGHFPRLRLRSPRVRPSPLQPSEHVCCMIACTVAIRARPLSRRIKLVIFSSRARCLCGGLGLCFFCPFVLGPEVMASMHHPSPVDCVEHRGHDLGPPEGCGAAGLPHARTISVSGLTSTATANSTGSGTIVSHMLAASPVVYDPEDYRVPPEPQLTSLPVASPPAPDWSPVGDHEKPVAFFRTPKVG